ncbi:hypothetical protein C5167_004092 [Papaver somniferum]|nr:hypothetical protein C5167_004092 [Papaver somniferum]
MLVVVIKFGVAKYPPLAAVH